MINLRQHIVSLTAVFLALGIGLAIGASFIDQVTVGVLSSNLDEIERENRDLEGTNDALRALVDEAVAAESQLRGEGLDQLVDGRLADVPVLVLAVRGIDEVAVGGLATTLSASGADLGGVLWLTDRVLLDEEGEVDDLRSVLDVSQSSPDLLRRSLVSQLGDTLVEAMAPVEVEPTDPGTDPTSPPDATVPPDPTVPDPTSPDATTPDATTPPDTVVETTTTTADPGPTPMPDIVRALTEARFLELDAPANPPAGFQVVPEAGLRVVIMSGPGAVLPDDLVLLPLIEQIAEGAAPGDGSTVVVAAQTAPLADPDPDDDVPLEDIRVSFVGPLRRSETLRDRLTTVDTVDTFAGGVAVVLALDHGGRAGQFGHYGRAVGAQSLLPVALPPPAPG